MECDGKVADASKPAVINRQHAYTICVHIYMCVCVKYIYICHECVVHIYLYLIHIYIIYTYNVYVYIYMILYDTILYIE